jgi:hypothetical protein
MEISKVAPEGQFRVIGKDSPQDRGWVKGDYPDHEKARLAAQTTERSFVRFKVFNDKGECVHGERWS